jgi:hypothetical protein
MKIVKFFYAKMRKFPAVVEARNYLQSKSVNRHFDSIICLLVALSPANVPWKSDYDQWKITQHQGVTLKCLVPKSFGVGSLSIWKTIEFFRKKTRLENHIRDDKPI